MRYLLHTWVVVYRLAIDLGNYQSALRCTMCLLSDSGRLPQYPFSVHAAQRHLQTNYIFSCHVPLVMVTHLTATFEFQTLSLEENITCIE